MKVFDMEKYLTLKTDSIGDLMKKEYDFYRSITKNVNLNGNDYKVCHKVNFQCRTTLHCNSKCAFCIEKDSSNCKSIPDENYLTALEESISMIQAQGIYPTVTITGGEPCLYKEKLLGIMEVLKRKEVKKFNLNTNALYLDKDILSKMKEVGMPHLNISRHHFDDNVNDEIFSSKTLSTEGLKDIIKEIGGTYYDTTRICMQCVLIKDYIDCRTKIRAYLDYILSLGLDNVAFRGLSKLKEDECNDVSLHKYCNEHAVDIFEVISQIRNDSDFKLVAQNVSDHYTYEDWLYKGKVDVHFAYSDMDILKRYEVEELENEELFAREFVLYEDGHFCGGWNKDIKLIKKFS